MDSSVHLPDAIGRKGIFTPGNLNRVLLVLGFLGIFDASLLSAEKLYGLNLMCGLESGCDAVANHHSAYIHGIPVAYFGLLGYLALTFVAAVRALTGVKRGLLLWAGLGMATFGSLASLYYQYTMFVVIKAFCPYCFASAINMGLQFVTYLLLARSLSPSGAFSERKSGDVALVSLGLLATVVAVGIGASVLQSERPRAQIVSAEQPIGDLMPKKERMHSFGDPKSPILVIEFSDLACPVCQQATPKLHQLIDQHPGKIWTIYRHFPLIHRHPMAVTASLVSEYANSKGKFWDYVHGIMGPGEEPKTPDEVFAPAQAIGLNVDDIKKHITDANDHSLDVVNEDMNVANKFGINGTPTFFIEMKGHPVMTCTATDIFDVLSKPPYSQVIGK